MGRNNVGKQHFRFTHSDCHSQDARGVVTSRDAQNDGEFKRGSIVNGEMLPQQDAVWSDREKTYPKN